MSMTINIGQAKELVMDVLRAKLVPFIQSSPGIGKSDLVRQIAKDNQLKLIDIRLSQMDPSDLLGFPFVKGDKAGYVPMDTFPIEGDEIPEGYKGFLVFMDEFNAASMSVQAAAYRIVLDKEVGQHKLHKNVAVVAAGNLSTDKAIVNRLSTAMQSRLVHLEINVDFKEFIKWADKNGVDHRVKSFIHFKPEALHKFDANHAEVTFPCPRTWEFTSRLVKPYEQLTVSKLPIIAGAIGEGMAREFYSYSKLYGELPHLPDILANPEGVSFGNEPSVHYALSGLVSANITEKNIDKLMKFLSRLAIDFQVIALRSAIARNRELNKTAAVKNWIKHHASELAD